MIVNGTRMYRFALRLDQHGYYRYSLRNKDVFAHRLVAMAYIPNPNNYPIVNHIDCNPKNNHYSNLEWCTYKHNTEWMFTNGYMPKTKTALVYKDDVLVKEFPTPRQASLFICQQTGTTERNVQRRKQYGKYKIVIPENGDTVFYSKTANHHFTTKEQSRLCYLFQNTKLIKSFSSKNEALLYCKNFFGSSDGIRRHNYQAKNQLYLVYDIRDLDEFKKKIALQISHKGETSKQQGFLYQGDKLIGEFSSINKASLYCKATYNCKLSPKKPYYNISNKLLFVLQKETPEKINDIWANIIRRSQYRPTTVW